MRASRLMAIAASFTTIAAACGGNDAPPTDADVIACLRDEGAEVARADSASGGLNFLPPGTDLVGEARWSPRAATQLYRASNAGEAREAERYLVNLVAKFDTSPEHVKRAGTFVVVTVPDRPSPEQTDALVGCVE